MNYDNNLLNLVDKLDDVKEDIKLIETIINMPNFNKRELMYQLKMAQEKLTNATIAYIYGEYRKEKQRDI